jgi:hypothetical protein
LAPPALRAAKLQQGGGVITIGSNVSKCFERFGRNAVRVTWKIVWKALVLILALLFGGIGANQAGWSYTEVIANRAVMGASEQWLTAFMGTVGFAFALGSLLLARRIATPALWVMLPVLAYCALVLGAWNGYASDFDTYRFQAIRHHRANAYTIEHMTKRGRYLSCQDQRIELTDDAEEACAQALSAPVGETISGSGHSSGER